MDSARLTRTRIHSLIPCTRCCVALLLLTLCTDSAMAASTQYTYDNLGRVTQAAQTNGVTVQYQYDANGNATSTTLTNTSALTLNSPLNVGITSPGQSVMLPFSVTSGQSLLLTLTGISTSPAGANVTVSVYNSIGALVTTTSGSTTATLNLSNLTAGTYSANITPPSGTTATLQASVVIPSTSSNTADAPLPAWALLMLGAGLLGMVRRFAQGT